MTTSNFSNSTEAAKSGLNLTLDPVEKFIFAGLQKRMTQSFEAKTAWVTSTDKAKTLQAMFGSPSQEASELKVTYPYMTLQLNSLADAQERANTNATVMRGIPNVLPTDDGHRSFRVEYIPTDFSVSIEYTTNSFKDVLKFARIWLWSRHKGLLNFDVTYGRASFSISAVPDSNIQIPSRDAELEGSSEYVLTQTLTVQGYMSNATLIEQQITTTVQEQHVLASSNEVIWTFQSPENDYTPLDPAASTSNSRGN